MRVWMVFLAVAGCADDKAGETGETADSGETGESGDTAPDDVPAVVYDYYSSDPAAFSSTCTTVVVDGTPEPVDIDSDGTVDCGRADETGPAADILVSTYLDGSVVEEHSLTEAELTAGVQALVGKARSRGGAVDFDETCTAVCDAMFLSMRKGDCPEFKGVAVAASENAFVSAMNTVNTQLATSLTIDMSGAWCWVSTRPADLVASPGITQAPVNIWWGVIYGLKNYSAGSVVYANDNPTIAVYGLTYKVPGKVAVQYSSFLAGSLTSSYPTGASFTLTPVAASYSTNGTSTTTGSWPSWWAGPTGTGIIDPVFGDPTADLQALNDFIAVHAADQGGVPVGSFGAEGDCPVSDGYAPYDDPSTLTGDPADNNEAITFDEECPEAP